MEVDGVVYDVVALRKESVDRNFNAFGVRYRHIRSLSARRAWIEITSDYPASCHIRSLSARRAWIEIPDGSSGRQEEKRRSPQGERG